MPLWLDMESPDFETAFKALLSDQARGFGRRRPGGARHHQGRGCRGRRGAQVRYSARNSTASISMPGRLYGSPQTKSPWRRQGGASADALAALRLAHSRIVSFHKRQRPEDLRFTRFALGVDLGWRWTAIQAVGLYVPGGTASYPSSVLMNAIPAKVVGVERHRDGRADAGRYRINPLVLAAADLAGVDEIYRVGGAQADGGARLWHRDYRAGVENRRPGQRLCRRRQAAGLRHRRHRHDRRAV